MRAGLARIRFSSLSSSSLFSSSPFLSSFPSSSCAPLTLVTSKKAPLFSPFPSLSPLPFRKSSFSTSFPNNNNKTRDPHSKEELQREIAHRATKLGQPAPQTHPHLFYSKDEVTPGITKGEYRERRERLMGTLPPNSVAILSGNTQKLMSNDIPYVFHQHTDLLYLCGFIESGAILVLVKGETQEEMKTILFCQAREKGRETWDGIITGPERVVEGFGVDEAYPHPVFERKIKEIIEESAHVFVDTPSRMTQTEKQFLKVLERELWEQSGKKVEREQREKRKEEGRGEEEERRDWEVEDGEALTGVFQWKQPYSSYKEEVANLVLSLRSSSSSSSSSPSSPFSSFVSSSSSSSSSASFSPSSSSSSSSSSPPFSLYPLSPLLQILRVFKSPSEVDLLRSASAVTNKAFQSAMRATRPGFSEHQLMSHLQYVSQMSGAERLAYPPVVAGGGNSLILHYVSCDEVLREGDMVLVDGGVELNHYVSDVTRVWPVGGGEEGFSERQREVYEVVRGVVDLCVGKCRSGVGMMEVHSVGVGGLVLGLKKLGILNGGMQEILLGRQFLKYYPHSTCHYLGMDVHDTPLISKTKKMSAGMVLTIEPGLYIPSDDPSPYAGIGIRLEENVLVTNRGCEVISSPIPIEMDDVEAVCFRKEKK